MPGKLDTTKDYIQPQWIVDSLNNLFLLPAQPYRPGVPPPAHLSPFSQDADEGYVPLRQKEINQLKGDVDVESSEEEEEEGNASDEEAPAPAKPAPVAS